MKVFCIFGTRPEAIKFAPVLKELDRTGIHEKIVCVSGQHGEMLYQMLDLFESVPDHDMKIMKTRQTLEEITSNVILGVQDVLKTNSPDLVLVQGDTTTALMGALAAYYQKIPVGHIEAGLRTDNKYSPFPEEMNRRLITQIADLHFAATSKAADNLKREGVKIDQIFITGNPVIDALNWIISKRLPFENRTLQEFDFSGKRVILLTTHRRENLDGGLGNIYAAIKRLLEEFEDVHVIFPVHLNPAVQKQAEAAFANVSQVTLVPPLSYSDLANLMDKSYLVMTDSGGIQEEAPALGKPVLVLRDTTERPEGVEAGTAALVGTDGDEIYNTTRKLLADSSAYEKMAKAVNPYGDGHAAEKIVEAIIGYFEEA